MKHIIKDGLKVGHIVVCGNGSTTVQLYTTVEGGVYACRDSNSPFYPGGLPIYEYPNKILPKPGEVVLLNPTTKLSVSDLEIAPKTRIGVVIGNDEQSSYIRWLHN